MKSQDIVILAKIFLLKDVPWSIADLSRELIISGSEIHAGLNRLKTSGLYNSLSKQVIHTSMEEFLIHGFSYTFPAIIGPQERGMPTAHSAPFFTDRLVASDSDIYVWPYELGTARGTTILPLYPTVPSMAEHDAGMYSFLSLLDALRVGRAREKTLAKKEIIRILRRK